MQLLERVGRDSHVESPHNVQGKGEKRKLPELSKDTLERHNKCYRKTNEAFGRSAIRQEAALACDQIMYGRHYGKVVALHDGFVPGPDERSMPSPSPPSTNNINIYASTTASSETPMGRFMFPSPAVDAQPWLARGMLADSGLACGTMESLESRRLAMEFMAPDNNEDEADGSLCHSSPTLPALSKSEAMRLVNEKKERGFMGNPRVQRNIKRRRAHTSRDAQDSRNTPE
ncbi:hypothetical protein BU16DRAFT_554974 [Lophium mytilinum]|uniref:Uncharacterized protein n=1 Tax=Lophium mytilinum TaxID=390894 RepID=A0A6A6RE44_9PEZI|nr:hypothetical protein BU16DRAFT_554974 [Lophium mytilinum]